MRSAPVLSKGLLVGALALLASACATTGQNRSPETAEMPEPPPPVAAEDGFDEAEVIAAAEGVFGKGAEGLAKLIEDIVNDRGRPNAYIVGREGSGAVGVGLRYGAGTLYHRVEGNREVHWSGPSIGFDVGGDANRVFTLIYGLYDTEDLFRRYPAVEGKVYVVGGFTANYLQRENVAVVPVKLGVGWRVGANVGYLKFSKRRNIVPF
ncbi:DUF1134 domain-containing protein [Pacificimonas sp. WHA3]|uniref:DUF1134 domain-containing protein n=1 Tax=Pacificimonas pallii TaxID=2827236 RepID=A0ABS6SF18_9SPHN|nr:EipA family protein [Pacificimonas pallii]MBV7256698.1 DUF1134 domain-containing protein [Pacificimonas pallii]